MDAQLPFGRVSFWSRLDYFFWLVAIAIIINSVQWVGLLWQSSVLSGQGVIPLRYSVYFGIDYIGRWELLFLLPSLGTVIIVVHTLVARFLRKQHTVLAYTILVVGLFIQACIALGLGSIIYINI